jgi:SAM-dependent methyltransferase
MIVTPDFDRLYRADPDPWQVSSSWYERRKLSIVLACLLRTRYALAWDPACGTGHLAARLSELADQVLATDGSAAAVELSRQTCADRANVRCALSALPAQPVGGDRFDLVVLSEFVYYLTAEQRLASLATVMALAPRAEIVAVHWRHRPHDAHLGGEETQDEIVSTLAAAGWQRAVHHLDADFVLDSLDRSDGER